MARRIAALFGLAAVVLLAAAAIDDGRFWLRYIQRIPVTFKWPGAKSQAPVPPTRAVIKGGLGPNLDACAPALTPALAQALSTSQSWLDKRNTDAFLVWHNGCLIHERYSRGDAGTLRPTGPMAKVLVAVVAGRAIREGLVPSLDTPAATYISEWRGDGRREITLRHMLAMHSGLDWYHQTKSPWGTFQRHILGGDYVPAAVAIRRVSTPGADYDYSAWTYDLVGIALARASGRTYETLASDLVWRPLGMSDAQIYVDRPGGTVHANCCLWTTARDWVRLGALLVEESRQSRLLPEGFVAAMRQGRPDQPNYGLGVWLGSPYAKHRSVAGTKSGRPTPVKSRVFQSEPFAADDVLIFEGVEDTKAWVIPSTGLVVVRMGGKAKDWDEAVVPNLLMRSLADAAMARP